MLNRRRFLRAVSASLLAAPLLAEAQQAAKVPRVGVLVESGPASLAAFRQGLRELGYIEGQNVLLEIRWEKGLPGIAALISELVRVPVDVIVVQTTGVALAAKRATSTIPIVAAAAGALVESGAAASLARPGGNVTGLTVNMTELSAKRLELLKEAMPNISRVAVLASPYTLTPATGERFLKATEAAAQTLGVHLLHLRVVEGPADLEGAFQAARRGRADAVIILANTFFGLHAARVGELVLKYRLPTIGYEFSIVEAGGFMAYNAKGSDLWRRAATYVDKILKGAKPADLPIEQPTKFDLVVNLKTAKALGLTIPPSLLLRADQVIE